MIYSTVIVVLDSLCRRYGSVQRFKVGVLSVLLCDSCQPTFAVPSFLYAQQRGALHMGFYMSISLSMYI